MTTDMPLCLYLDDCSDNKALTKFLSNAGHTIISPRAVGTNGYDDVHHLEYAADHGYVLLTRNPRDFVELHKK